MVRREVQAGAVDDQDAREQALVDMVKRGNDIEPEVGQ
jgi:hypothetical protein